MTKPPAPPNPVDLPFPMIPSAVGGTGDGWHQRFRPHRPPGAAGLLEEPHGERRVHQRPVHRPQVHGVHVQVSVLFFFLTSFWVEIGPRSTGTLPKRAAFSVESSPPASHQPACRKRRPLSLLEVACLRTKVMR